MPRFDEPGLQASRPGRATEPGEYEVTHRQRSANDEGLEIIEAAGSPAIVLARHLIISAFTPSATSVFNIRSGDLGRPLTDLTSRLPLPGLFDDIAAVFETGATIEREIRHESAPSNHRVRSSPRIGPGGDIDGVVVTFTDLASVDRTLVDPGNDIVELHHRVRNMLMVAISLAQQTYRSSINPETFLAAFTGRLHAMARAYDLLSRQDRSKPSLEDLARVQLSRFGAGRVDFDGPPVVLTPDTVLCLGPVLHELLTNALKFGALSTPEGRISVSWSHTRNEAGPGLTLRWTETGGPIIEPPVQRGFGLTFVEQEVGYSLAGSVILNFHSWGLEAELIFPLERHG